MTLQKVQIVKTMDHLKAIHFVNQKPVEDLNIICGICKDIPVDAQTVLDCLHIFCKRCINDWRQTHEACPCCSTKITLTFKDTRIISFLSKQVVKCPRFDKGCSVTGDFGSKDESKGSFFEYHRKECMLLEMGCPFEALGCSVRLERRLMKQHILDSQLKHMCMALQSMNVRHLQCLLQN
jgi:hypothetical protein